MKRPLESIPLRDQLITAARDLLLRDEVFYADTLPSPTPEVACKRPSLERKLAEKFQLLPTEVDALLRAAHFGVHDAAKWYRKLTGRKAKHIIPHAIAKSASTNQAALLEEVARAAKKGCK